MCIHSSGTKGSLTRTTIFICLHFITAWTIGFALTGSLSIATGFALLEPLFNAVWYFLLDKFISSKCAIKGDKHGPGV